MRRLGRTARSAALLLPFAAAACAGHIGGTGAPPPVVESEPTQMGLPPAPGRYDGAIDVLHYDVEVVLPPGNDRIVGRTTILYLSRTAGPHPVTLDLTGLAVESLTWGGAPVAFSYERGEIRFTAPGAASAADTLSVEVRTRGTPDDGLILSRNVHGEPSAFGDNWPNRARFWFPSQDHPSDKATVAFTVHAPDGRRVVANGVLVEGPAPADPARTAGVPGLVTWRWENRVPIPTYLMVIGAAPMEVLDGGLAACGRAPASPRPDGCVEITAWAFPPDTAHARQVFARSGAMLDLYAELVGPYPYEKLANVQSSTRFGGMENASAIFYSEQALAQRRDIEGTVAHEIAHQWFGNSVTPADWPHLWLSEGFASYFGPLFYERVDGVEAFRQRIEGARQAYLRSGVTGRPVVDERAANLLDLLNENSYQKGALVLHMLRWVMGEERFFEGVRHYYARHRDANADTDDLRRALEEVHGQPLDWFFRQWLLEPGYPAYRVEWSWDAARGEAEVTVRQEQDPAWPAFRMPVELEFQLPGGPQRVVRQVEGRQWTERIALPAAPSALRFDPDGWLLATANVDLFQTGAAQGVEITPAEVAQVRAATARVLLDSAGVADESRIWFFPYSGGPPPEGILPSPAELGAFDRAAIARAFPGARFASLTEDLYACPPGVRVRMPRVGCPIRDEGAIVSLGPARVEGDSLQIGGWVIQSIASTIEPGRVSTNALFFDLLYARVGREGEWRFVRITRRGAT